MFGLKLFVSGWRSFQVAHVDLENCKHLDLLLGFKQGQRLWEAPGQQGPSLVVQTLVREHPGPRWPRELTQRGKVTAAGWEPPLGKWRKPYFSPWQEERCCFSYTKWVVCCQNRLLLSAHGSCAISSCVRGEVLQPRGVTQQIQSAMRTWSLGFCAFAC